MKTPRSSKLASGSVSIPLSYLTQPICCAAVFFFLCALPLCPDSLAQSGEKAKVCIISFGDRLEDKPQLDHKRISTKDEIEQAIRKLKRLGFTAIYWRVLWEGHPLDQLDFYTSRIQREASELRAEFENTPYAWDPHELKWPAAVAHELGLKFYAWIVPYNGGAPPGSKAELGIQPYSYRYPHGAIYETQFPYQASFIRENRHYQLVDRTGERYHYGVLEWAYPEARRYWVDNVTRLLDGYDVDGIYMDTRTECMAADHADQFGFNQPVVEEYKRRHGVDIRTEDFDLEKWRQLRGEYFTQLLREISQVVHSRDKILALGTARGNYIGFPLGNMKLEWRRWIREKLIDVLHLDERGWAWGRHGYGYLTDPATGRGLRPFEEMIREDYGPHCRSHGVSLYFKPSLYPDKDEAWKQRVAQMAEFDGIIALSPLR